MNFLDRLVSELEPKGLRIGDTAKYFPKLGNKQEYIMGKVTNVFNVVKVGRFIVMETASGDTIQGFDTWFEFVEKLHDIS